MIGIYDVESQERMKGKRRPVARFRNLAAARFHLLNYTWPLVIPHLLVVIAYSRCTTILGCLHCAGSIHEIR